MRKRTGCVGLVRDGVRAVGAGREVDGLALGELTASVRGPERRTAAEHDYQLLRRLVEVVDVVVPEQG